MRLLVLHSELGVLRGGGENFTRNLFSAFAERGHDVEAAFLADRGGGYPIPLPTRIKPIPIRGWWSRNPGQRIFASIRRCLPHEEQVRAMWDWMQQGVSWRAIKWHDRRFQRRIERQFLHNWDDFDAVYVHASPLLASRVARYRPTVLRLPGPTSADLEPVLRAVQAVCANGDALVQIREFLGDHAIELPIGVDRDRFNPSGASVRSRLGWDKRHPIVGYVGRLTHLKGVDLLAMAFQEASRTMANAKLLIIGRGPEETFIRSILKKELTQGSVHIESDVGHTELPSWYRAMDLLVMPSRYENFSNAILEAMACGVPFLASSIGGNLAMAKSGAGWLFEADSASSLAQQLLERLKEPAERKARGHLGLAYVQTHHGWSASAERLEQILTHHIGKN